MNHLNELLEQPLAKQMLQVYLDKKPPAFMILHGHSGTGKWSAAEAFIRQFFCTVGNACGNCLSCQKLIHNNHPDYIRFPDDKIAIGSSKDPAPFTIRWLLQTRLPYRPMDGDARIVLFQAGEKIQNEAETALLKTLEEPPLHTHFIMLVNQLSQLKTTIVSRGVSIPFYLLSDAAVQKIANFSDPLALNCLGGSLNHAPLLHSKLYKKTKTKIEASLQHPLELAALEKWLLQLGNLKVLSENAEIDIDFHTFLDFFGLLFMILVKDLPQYKELVLATFHLKQGIHQNMAGLDPYLISRFIAKIHTIQFP